MLASNGFVRENWQRCVNLMGYDLFSCLVYPLKNQGSVSVRVLSVFLMVQSFASYCVFIFPLMVHCYVNASYIYVSFKQSGCLFVDHVNLEQCSAYVVLSRFNVLDPFEFYFSSFIILKATVDNM